MRTTTDASSARGRPDSTTAWSSWRPAARPSPVGPDRRLMRWPLCSPPITNPPRAHLLEHVPVADVGPAHLDAASRASRVRKPRLVMVVVTTASAVELPAVARAAARGSPGSDRRRPPLRRGRRPARGRRRRRRPARGRPRAARPPPASASRWVEPHPTLMLTPSGASPMTSTSVGAEPAEHVGCADDGGAVGAVEDQPQAGEIDGEPFEQSGDVAIAPLGPRHDRPEARRPPAGGPAASIACSTAASSASGSLKPSAPKSLIPLSGKGLCEALITAPATASPRLTSSATAGVGSTPPSSTCTPALASPAASAAFEHRAAAAGVTAHEHRRAGAEAAPECPADREGQLGCEVAVRDASHAVGAEQRSGGLPQT